VPHFKSGVLNLLKVVDLSQDDRAELIKLGFGDLLLNPAHKAGKDLKDKKYDLKKEKEDPLSASTISVNIVSFKTSLTAPIEQTPKRFYIQMKFFTFPEIQTDTISLVGSGGGSELLMVAGCNYFLAKEQPIHDFRGKSVR
jgi:hypothetical protein